MLENMFTTKMSANHKKLQTRFLKIRSSSGKLAKILGLCLLCLVIVSIIIVSVIMSANNAGDSKMTDEELSNHAQVKANIVNASLKENEEILTNSGFIWEADDKTVKLVLDKLSQNRQIKFAHIKKEGNYDIRIYSIWNNVKDESQIRLFIIDNYKMELVFSMNISFEEQNSLVNLLNYPTLPKKEFYPSDISGITNAQLVIKDKVYPILNRSNLPKIEKMLSNAKTIKFATDCPFNAVLIITKENGDQGTITLALDSCAVFKTGDTYYDYSDGDNSEMLSFFGIDSKNVFDLQ